MPNGDNPWGRKGRLVMLASCIGDTAALLLLLIFATIRPSPVNPRLKQIDQAPTCRYTKVYEAWICIAIIRYFLSAVVGAWVEARLVYAARKPDIEAPVEMEVVPIELPARPEAAHIVQPVQAAPPPPAAPLSPPKLTFARRIDAIAAFLHKPLMVARTAVMGGAFGILFFSANMQHCAPLLWYAVLFFCIDTALFIFAGCIVIATILTLPCIIRKLRPASVPKRELDQCTTVCYVPDPNESTPEPSIYSTVEQGDIVARDAIDHARLPHPAAVLSANQRMCAVCHSSFTPPRLIDGQQKYAATPLRKLPCGHVFHIECVEPWLLQRSDKCPYCNQNVRELLRS